MQMTRRHRGFNRTSMSVSQIHSRCGAISLEAVMVAAVLFPIAAALLFLAMRVSSVVYSVIHACLELPYP